MKNNLKLIKFFLNQTERNKLINFCNKLNKMWLVNSKKKKYNQKLIKKLNFLVINLMS